MLSFGVRVIRASEGYPWWKTGDKTAPTSGYITVESAYATNMTTTVIRLLGSGVAAMTNNGRTSTVVIAGSSGSGTAGTNTLQQVIDAGNIATGSINLTSGYETSTIYIVSGGYGMEVYTTNDALAAASFAGAGLTGRVMDISGEVYLTGSLYIGGAYQTVIDETGGIHSASGWFTNAYVYTDATAGKEVVSWDVMTNALTIATNGFATITYVDNATNGIGALQSNVSAISNDLYAALANTNNWQRWLSESNLYYLASNPSNYVTASVTNGLASIGYVDNATNSLYPRNNPSNYVTASVTNGLASIGYVDAATQNLVTASVTNGLASIGYVDAATQNLVTASITNGLASIGYVDNATNGIGALRSDVDALSVTSGAHTVYISAISNDLYAALVHTNDWQKWLNESNLYYLASNPSNYVTASVTNGLASIGYVDAATQSLVTVSVTNGLASIGYVNNATQGLFKATAWSEGLTNSFSATGTTLYIEFKTNYLDGWLSESNLYYLASNPSNYISTNQTQQITNEPVNAYILRAYVSGADTSYYWSVDQGGAFTNQIGDETFTNTGFILKAGSNLVLRKTGDTNFFDLTNTQEITNSPSNGQVLTAYVSGSTTNYYWSTVSGSSGSSTLTNYFFCRMLLAQTLGAAAWTKLQFSNEISDVDGLFAVSRFTAARTGRYYISAGMESLDGDNRAIAIYTNGLIHISSGMGGAGTAPVEIGSHISGLVGLTNNEYVEIYGQIAGGGGVVSTNTSSFFQGIYLGN